MSELMTALQSNAAAPTFASNVDNLGTQDTTKGDSFEAILSTLKGPADDQRDGPEQTPEAGGKSPSSLEELIETISDDGKSGGYGSWTDSEPVPQKETLPIFGADNPAPEASPLPVEGLDSGDAERVAR